MMFHLPIELRMQLMGDQPLDHTKGIMLNGMKECQHKHQVWTEQLSSLVESSIKQLVKHKPINMMVTPRKGADIPDTKGSQNM